MGKIQPLAIWGEEPEEEAKLLSESLQTSTSNDVLSQASVTRNVEGRKDEDDNDWTKELEGVVFDDVESSEQNHDACFICGAFKNRKFDRGLQECGHIVCQACLMWARDYNGSYNMISQTNGLKESGLSLNDVALLARNNLLVVRSRANPNQAAKHPMKLYYQFQLALGAMSKTDFWWTQAVKRVAAMDDFDPLVDDSQEIEARRSELLQSNQESLARIVRARFHNRRNLTDEIDSSGEDIDSSGISPLWKSTLERYRILWRKHHRAGRDFPSTPASQAKKRKLSPQVKVDPQKLPRTIFSTSPGSHMCAFNPTETIGLERCETCSAERKVEEI